MAPTTQLLIRWRSQIRKDQIDKQ